MNSLRNKENKKPKCKHDNLSDNKENNASKKLTMKEKKAPHKSALIKVNFINDFIKKENNTKIRAPLRDINVDSDNNCKAPTKTFKNCAEEYALTKIPEECEDSFDEVDIKEENKIKHITTQRNYDFSPEDFELYKLVPFLDIVSNTEKIIVEEDSDIKPTIGVSNTPINTLIPKSCKVNIKEVRKNNLKDCSKLELTQEALSVSQCSVNLLEQKCNEEVTNFLTKANINSISNEIQETYYGHCLKKNTAYKPNAYFFSGTVYLDTKENYVFYKILYSSPYLNHIVEHQLKKEYNYNLSDDFLKKYYITNTSRSIVINWLIKLQAYMRTEHALVYTAVRLMDQVLDSLELPLNMLQLVALASFWISLKYHAMDHKNASWMVKQSGGAYTTLQLVVMERQVFQINNFNVNTVDLTIYVHYYILHLQIKNADIISHCSHYILDCALLDSRFVRTLPSMMAAGAVFTSLHLMNQYNDQIWDKLYNNKGYYKPEELMSIMNNLIYILKEVNNPTFQCREPYYKYSSSRYCNVTHIVLDAFTQI